VAGTIPREQTLVNNENAELLNRGEQASLGETSHPGVPGLERPALAGSRLSSVRRS